MVCELLSSFDAPWWYYNMIATMIKSRQMFVMCMKTQVYPYEVSPLINEVLD